MSKRKPKYPSYWQTEWAIFFVSRGAIAMVLGAIFGPNVAVIFLSIYFVIVVTTMFVKNYLINNEKFKYISNIIDVDVSYNDVVDSNDNQTPLKDKNGNVIADRDHQIIFKTNTFNGIIFVNSIKNGIVNTNFGVKRDKEGFMKRLDEVFPKSDLDD